VTLRELAEQLKRGWWSNLIPMGNPEAGAVRQAVEMFEADPDFNAGAELRALKERIEGLANKHENYMRTRNILGPGVSAERVAMEDILITPFIGSLRELLSAPKKGGGT
jgi:hypothetical protein